MPVSRIQALEASLTGAVGEEARAIAQQLSDELQAMKQVPSKYSAESREQAVRAARATAHYYYYQVDAFAQAKQVLTWARDLATELGGEAQVELALQSSEIDLLTGDVGSAIEQTAVAMALAKELSLTSAEARAWLHYAMALQAAGLYKQADTRLAHALTLVAPLDEPRLRGNAWGLRCQLRSHLTAQEYAASEYACDEALQCALQSPPRFRNNMAITAHCNRAALSLLQGNLGVCEQSLAAADAYPTTALRPRWLIEVMRCLLAIRKHDDAAANRRLDELLATDQASARAYVNETYSVMAAMFTAMGDAARAGDALRRLSVERTKALWKMLMEPAALATQPASALAGEPVFNVSMGMLERLAVTSELRDDATGKHCYRVGRLAMRIAQQVGESSHRCAAIELAARIHDIGKFVVPDAILLKPGPLTATELALMRQHTIVGGDFLRAGTGHLVAIAERIARHHHEYWDGTGYPDGLRADAIPFEARVTAIADVYDALTHQRSYKPAWPHAQAVAYIKDMAGRQFDPTLTIAFLALMEGSDHNVKQILAELDDSAATSYYVRSAEELSGV
jgi:putative two-component system response regulator